MRRRPHQTQQRNLTPEESEATARCLSEHWPGRMAARTFVESSNQLVIEWQAGSGPVIEQRFSIEHLAEHAVLMNAGTSGQEHSTNYRQDRAGELWHVIPDNEHQLRGRALCGAPRQGTRLSETNATTAPSRAQMCELCLERLDRVAGKDSSDVLVSAPV